MLYQLHLGQSITTHPTVGSNVEQVKHGKLTFEVSAGLHAGGTLHCRVTAQSHRPQAGLNLFGNHIQSLCGVTICWNPVFRKSVSCVVQVWDLGGQANLRPSWATYYQHTDCVILVRLCVDIRRRSWCCAA